MEPQQLRQALLDLNAEQRKEALRGIESPDRRTTNRIWIIVVGGIVLVLLGAAGFLGVAFWTDPAGDDARVTADTMLSLFTGAIGFLAGLFSPSPVSRND